jgi:EAL domain-containing protein (putative c-di-GMP-specific phosphodiesterase class I)
VQFRSPGLFETVCEALLSSHLTAEGLELELTESILIGDTETTLGYVKRLKTLGLKLSIDDFGTGYSSLSYLKRFQVDKLKIDQSFIRDMDQNPDDSAIVHAIIQMAHSLGLRTIAEGVEHEHMITHLRIHQCDEVQGYFYGRPMPAAEFEAFLQARQTATVSGNL